MLKIAIVDANEKANKEYAGLTSSVVSGWLRWEIEQADLPLSLPNEADVVLLVFSGALDWLANSKSYLRKHEVDDNPVRRDGRPYIITGGPVDATPLTALSVADCVTIGEAYRYVRELLRMIKADCDIDMLRDFNVQYPHAIERSQISQLKMDENYPWMFQKPIEPIASPDDYVDWGVPPVRSDDKVVRLIAEKGCHCKCTFCATTYRQTHRQNPNEEDVLQRLRTLKERGERVQLISNDPMALKYFKRINVKLDSQSFTIMEVSDDKNRRGIINSGIGIARFGVEGISERIRKAFAKPITNDHLLDVLRELHENKINTHMFFIVNVPGESADDWEAYKDFYARLATTIRNGICRIKFTTFVNTPPAPLARFVPTVDNEYQLSVFREWIAKNAASRHLVYVRGRGGKSHVVNIAEQLSITKDQATRLYQAGGVVDLAPSVDYAYRMPWEIVRWPLSTETRYKISSVYYERMGLADKANLVSIGKF